MAGGSAVKKEAVSFDWIGLTDDVIPTAGAADHVSSCLLSLCVSSIFSVFAHRLIVLSLLSLSLSLSLFDISV